MIAPGLDASPRDTRRLLAAIVALAAVLRLVHANADYWFDEIVTVMFYATPSLGNIVTHYNFAGNHVLYSVLLRIATGLAGTEPWVARLPAIAFGVAGVWAFWFVARQIWARRPALLGTFLYAVSYHHIFYSQDARAYTALLFFSLIATGCLLRMLANESRASWRLNAIGYGLAMALGFYAMLLMMFVAAGHGFVLLLRRRWAELAVVVAGVLLAGLMYAPMMSSLIAYYQLHPSNTGYPLFSAGFARLIAPVAIALVLAAIVGGPIVLRLWRRQSIAVELLLAPIAFNVLVPLVRGQGVYPRSFVYALAAGYLVQIEVIDWAAALRPVLASAWVALITIVSIVQLVPYYRLPKQGFRQALTYVDTHRAPSDDRVGLTLAGKAVRFYDPTVVLIYSADDWRQWARAGHQRAWIMSTFPDELLASAPDLYSWLQRQPLMASFPGVIGDGTVEVRQWTAGGPE